MPNANYLLVGSSHAALEALRAIRQHDRGGSIAMITRDRHLPYSPTLLPYVVSGRTAPERTALRDAAFFAENGVTFVPEAPAVGLDTGSKTVELGNGDRWRYDRLLIATGAAPSVPPIPGLDGVPFHRLRSLDDANRLRDALPRARSAVILGAGLVGLHAAESLARAGLEVSVVEREAQVLSAYFDPQAAALIAEAFAYHGVDLRLGRTASAAAPGADGRGCRVTLDDAATLDADLLLVATGVAPVTGWLRGSGIEVDRGVLVDDTMRTSAEDVWASGDVAQATDFHSGGKALIGIVPTAVEQGTIAGMAMAGDPYLRPYPGGVPVNTYRYFGHTALSVGQAAATEDVEAVDAWEQGYRRIVMADGRLVGFASIDQPFDVGVMIELIRRRVAIAACRDAFLASPAATARQLMNAQRSR